MPNNEEFVRSFESASAEIIARLMTNMQTACIVIERDAKVNCPIDQGYLRASMNHTTGFDGETIVGTISNSSEYAPYVHQGTGIYAVNGDGRKTPWGYEALAGKYKGFHWTRGQKPQPFLQKARDDNKNKVVKILAGE